TPSFDVDPEGLLAQRLVVLPLTRPHWGKKFCPGGEGDVVSWGAVGIGPSGVSLGAIVNSWLACPRTTRWMTRSWPSGEKLAPRSAKVLFVRTVGVGRVPSGFGCELTTQISKSA